MDEQSKKDYLAELDELSNGELLVKFYDLAQKFGASQNEITGDRADIAYALLLKRIG
jgi:transcriptional antiterminator